MATGSLIGRISLGYTKRRCYAWGKQRKIWEDEPIEVKIYRTKCDEADTLPCRECGINICEECRWYPREPPMQVHSRRQPHLNSAHQHENTMAFALSAMQGLRRSSRANSSMSFVIVTYYRWICPKCVQDEFNFTREYYSKHTAHEWMDRYWDEPSNDYDDEDIPYKSKVTQDHQHHLMLFCICDANVPQETRPRCTWCKRRHLPENEWPWEFREIGSTIPILEKDPCYPPYVGDIYADCCNRPYPKLAYSGPIWQAPASVEHSRWVTGAEVAD